MADRGLSIFKTVYLELIGNDATAKELADFLSSRVGNDASSVRAYILTTPVFFNKYSVIIRSLYVMHHGEDPSEDIVKEFLTGMKESVYDLEGAIKRKGQPEMAPVIEYGNANDDTDSTSVIDVHAGMMRGDIVRNVATNAQTLDSGPIVIVKEPVLDADAVSGFEAVAKRPMSVHEYFKYVVSGLSGLTGLTGTNINHDWSSLWKKQIEVYNRIRNLMNDYCEVPLSEHDFLRNHLFEMDDPSFEESFINDIVDSDVYETQMKSRIRKIYKETFDSDMSQLDVDYLFDEVREDRRSMASAELRGVVMEFYKATNNIIAHASEVYNKVVDRYPDSVELIDIITMYRENSHRDFDQIAVDLERSLVKSLEFHDVLKSRIQKAAQLNAKSLIPSKLYGIMQKLLAKVDTITMETLNNEIVNLLDM